MSRKLCSKIPKPRNLEARALRSSQYSLKVIPNKLKKIFRKRKHRLGNANEND